MVITSQGKIVMQMVRKSNLIDWSVSRADPHHRHFLNGHQALNLKVLLKEISSWEEIYDSFVGAGN